MYFVGIVIVIGWIRIDVGLKLWTFAKLEDNNDNDRTKPKWKWIDQYNRDYNNTNITEQYQ